MKDAEYDAAASAVGRAAAELACKIADADDWTTIEGYVSAIPSRLRNALQPWAVQQRATPRRPPTATDKRSRPPRTTRHQREHRLDEALDHLAATQRATTRGRRAIQRARRRVARVRDALKANDARKRFATHERDVVETILRRAHADAQTPTESPSICPIRRDDVILRCTLSHDAGLHRAR
ncbi:hypothetical protein P43SY_012055 [Pythium insidiosum]|uniref:Uncharacterized protein n=1 Tax=Pythium insidiosum TaxID=114742 RepID=A0AAD5Q3Y3_PYTIN|nr:hypothetical protein P43SY_012055 [Pythium insidiosum]